MKNLCEEEKIICFRHVLIKRRQNGLFTVLNFLTIELIFSFFSLSFNVIHRNANKSLFLSKILIIKIKSINYGRKCNCNWTDV